MPNIKSHFKLILSKFIKREYLNEHFDFNNEGVLQPFFLEVDKIHLGPEANKIINSETITAPMAREIKKSCRGFYLELCNQISNRIDFNDSRLNAIQELNPCLLGESLIPLINLFPSLVLDEKQSNELENEWRLLLIQDMITTHKSIEEFWPKVFNLKNGFGEKMFPNITQFVAPLLALPHSSATVERIFSQLNLIKSKTRNRLLTPTINALMTAKEMLENSNSYDFLPSAELLSKYHKY